MAAASPITVDNLKAICLAGPIIAGVVTIVRLLERARSKRFGYDDGFAALSMCIIILFVAALFIHVGDPTHLSRSSKIGMYYILSQTFYGVIWTARLSILSSIIRITPAGGPKRILYGLFTSFVLIWVILFAQVFWVCENQPLWKDTPSPQCALGKDVAIAQLITDIYADSVLIVVPLRLLWNLGVSRAQRNRLLLVFSSSIITTLVSLIHAYYVLRVGGLVEVFVAIVEISVSLLVCNLAVVVGLIARFTEARGGKMQSSGFETHSMTRSRNPGLTGGVTVDFKTTRTVDDGLNVKVIDVHSGPLGSAYPREGGDAKAFHYPPSDHSLA